MTGTAKIAKAGGFTLIFRGPLLGDLAMPLERLEVLENLQALGFTLIFRGPLLGDLAMPLERLEVLENL